jgi:hypothetical protein
MFHAELGCAERHLEAVSVVEGSSVVDLEPSFEHYATTRPCVSSAARNGSQRCPLCRLQAQRAAARKQ